MFTTGSGKKINSLKELADKIKTYMKQPDTTLIVGADSQRVKRKYVFVLAIACIKKGEGGIFFTKKERIKPHRKMKGISAIISWKMWKEAQDIIDLIRKLEKYDVNISDIRVHLDLGHHGLSKEHISGITGWMRGEGFIPKIKPEAFVASGLADRFSKH